MSHPCKKCLVRAACSKECQEWSQYASIVTQIMTFIALMISGIMTVALLLWLTNIAETTNEEWPRLLLVSIWILSFSVASIIQAPYDKDAQIGVFARIMFAPMMAIWLIIIHSTKNYFRRP